MADLDFVHLHVHSSYSLLEGALPIARLAELAKADKQPALALTDTDNMFGALEFSEKVAGYGIQPIIGCALAIDFGDTENGARNGNAQADRQRIVLLAASEAGYRSLMRLNSRAFMESPPNEPPRLKVEWLDGETDGIIALTGGPGGPLDRTIAAGQSQVASARLDTLHHLFGDRLYVELQRHGMPHERMAEPVLIDFAYSRNIPLVATNEPFFATAADYESHDALICIAEGRYVHETDRRLLTSEHRYKTRAEMREQFADLPEAIASTVEIARRCAFRPRTRQPILPRFSVGADGDAVDEASELRAQAEAGLTRRLASAGLAPGFTEEQYRERLDFELKVIAGMKYPGYFLIVADFITWAKS
jgi:DNA polymerase-3 subunit alpha